jgi:hypothetical protein
MPPSQWKGARATRPRRLARFNERVATVNEALSGCG